MDRKPAGRDVALDAIADVFREHGYDGASLTTLSEATGLGKASLYHYFPGGKAEMAAEVFRHIGVKAQSSVLDTLQGGDSPPVKLRRFAKAVSVFYKHGRMNCIVGTMVLSGGGKLFEEQLKSSVEAWVAALAAVLAEAGFGRVAARQRAEDTLAMLQGALIVSRSSGQASPFLRMVRALPENMLAVDPLRGSQANPAPPNGSKRRPARAANKRA
jgi:TetR/AcrR family transcriptional repressor of lmrAB and yxaGH operons